MEYKNYFLTAAICFYVIGVATFVPFMAYITRFTAWAIICPAALVAAIILTVVYAKLRKKEKEFLRFKQENDFLSKKTERKPTKELAGNSEFENESDENARDIHSLISKIKRNQYNTIDVSDEEIEEIKEANPFLPESYITFLREVGFADLDWIDVGWNEKTPTNLTDGDLGFVKDILAAHKELNVDDFYFIAIVSDGGYYAFSKNPDDKKVYSFYHDTADIFTYESFEEFLYEILNV